MILYCLHVVMDIISIVLSIFFMRNVVTVNLFSNVVLGRMFPLIARITKHDTKEDNLVEGRENEGQVTEDTETKDLSSDDILTQLEKDKNALDKVDEAYDIAIDKFMKV